MPIEDRFSLETQAVIASNKKDEGLAFLTDAISDLLKKPTKQRREQFLRDLDRFPVKIDGKLVDKGVPTAASAGVKTGIASKKWATEFVGRDEITGLHQGLGGTLRLFLNNNYALNGQKGVFSFAETLKKVTLEKDKNVFSVNIEIPIHGLDLGFNRWVLDKEGNLKQIDLTNLPTEFPQYIKDEKLTAICFATINASIDCGVIPPKAKIIVDIETNCPKLHYIGPENHDNIAINTQTLVKPNLKPISTHAGPVAAGVPTPKSTPTPSPSPTPTTTTTTTIPTPTPIPTPTILKKPDSPKVKTVPLDVDVEKSLEKMRASRLKARKTMTMTKSFEIRRNMVTSHEAPKSVGGRPSNAARDSIKCATEINKLLKEKLLKDQASVKISLGESKLDKISPVLVEMSSALQKEYTVFATALRECGYLVTESKHNDKLELLIHHKGNIDVNAIENKYNKSLGKPSSSKPANG